MPASRPCSSRTTVESLEQAVALAQVMHAVGARARARARPPATPAIATIAAAIIECRSHWRPKQVEVGEDRRASRAGRAANSATPGTRNRCVGLCTSRKRRCRQPSRNEFSFDSPRRGWYSIGISSIRSPAFDARITISEANSIPGMRRSRLLERVAPERAHAAVGVADAAAVEEVQDAGQHRVADVAVQRRHRALVDASLAGASPSRGRRPSSSGSTNRPTSSKS